MYCPLLLRKRQITHSIREVLGNACQCYEFQVFDTTAYLNTTLLGINDADERFTVFHSASRFTQKVLIAGEYYAAQRVRPVEYNRIGRCTVTIFFRCEQINSAHSQTAHNSSLYILVHVQGNHQADFAFCC